MDPDPDSDSSIFIINLQDANKKLILNKKFSCPKMKSQKEVTKQ
jgi:hypothetical protein